MPPAPLLSIIIVAYKSRYEIEACLGSLPEHLCGGTVEVIVVDNSPGDGAGEIVHQHFPSVTYVTPETNLGYGRANNLAYSASNLASEFVLFLNPDTICNEQALEHCLRRLQNGETIGLISPKLVLQDGSMDLACRRSIPSLWDGLCRASGVAAVFPNTALFCGYNLTHLPDDGTYDVGAINGAFMLGRRSVFDAVVLKAESLKRKAADPDGLPRPAGPCLAMTEAELKADSLELNAASKAKPPLKANRSSFGVARVARTQIFDERFFMYGDDLDLCIRVAKAGYRIVYDGSVSITHLKGVSVAKDLDLMREAIFDANRDVYLKHFNPDGSKLVEWKYRTMFGLWKRVARWRAVLRGNQKVRPL